MAFLQCPAEPTSARAHAIEVDRINVGLALVNWCVLLLLMCALLLAKTLPSDSLLTGGLAAEECKSATKTCQDAQRK